MNSFSDYLFAFRVISSGYRAFVPGFVLVSLIFCLVSILGAIVPWFLKQATNSFTMAQEQPNTFYLFVAAYALCWALAEALSNIKGVFSAWILAGCDAAISKALLVRVMSLPYTEQARFNAGKLASIISRASGAFTSITVSVFWTLLPILIEFIVALTALGQSTDGVFLISFLISIVILAAISIVIAIQSRDLHSSLYKVMTDRDGYIVERLHLLYDIRLNNAYMKECSTIELHLNQVVQAIRKSNVQMGARLGLMAMAIGVALGVFTTLSVFTDDQQSITAGDFVMIAGYVGMLTLQLRLLAGALIDLEKQKVALADGIVYLKKPISETPSANLPSFTSTDCVFELKNVCIDKGGKKIIQNLNYRFLSNKFTVIRGASGRGKTTLMNAMLGLEPIDAGQILFNGVPVSTDISASVIDHVAVAPQFAQVMSGTLRDNLCYGIENEVPADAVLDDIVMLLNFTDHSSWRLVNLDNAKGVITYLRSSVPTLIVISHDAEVQAMADEILALD